MKLVLFGGFLGSGKTSLILSLARRLAGPGEHEQPRLVILENEIGEVGIDSKVIQAGGFSVRELFAGCICCTLSADLVTTLHELQEQVDPHWVIFEPTGLAHPGRILDTVNQYAKGIEGTWVVSVVDAERWEELMAYTPDLITGQVITGDLVLINKCDLVDSAKLERVCEQVRAVNPRAEIRSVSVPAGIDGEIWSLIDESAQR
jgi:G3E family GTPase